MRILFEHPGSTILPAKENSLQKVLIIFLQNNKIIGTCSERLFLHTKILSASRTVSSLEATDRQLLWVSVELFMLESGFWEIHRCVVHNW